MNMNYDVIIVGGGTAGCVLAARLTEDPKRSVLLLEAGPDYPNPDKLPKEIASSFRPAFTHDWGYYSEPGLYGRSIHLVRGKLVGGSSAVNACLAIRGTRQDFDSWAARGNPGWSFDNVLPFFRKLEDDADFTGSLHGEAGPVPIRRFPQHEITPSQSAFLETCYGTGFARADDMNVPDAAGAGRLPMNQVGGIRQSTALTYLDPARKRPNLTIRGGLTVDRVMFDGKRAQGIVIAGSGEKIFANLVILSAGTYGSPIILMRSGVGNSEHLRDKNIPIIIERPGVGQNLTDHPAFGVRLATIIEMAPDALVPAFQTALVAGEEKKPSAWRFMIKPTSIHPIKITTEYPSGYSIYASLAKPYSRGSIKLRSADPLVPPAIDPGYFTDHRDTEIMVEAVRTARNLSETPPLNELATREISPGPEITWSSRLEAAILAGFDTFHHPTGTCIMGTENDNQAVVNSTGKVYGAEGLYVVDASIMPEITSGPTGLPTIMVAEKCAEWLKKV